MEIGMSTPPATGLEELAAASLASEEYRASSIVVNEGSAGSRKRSIADIAPSWGKVRAAMKTSSKLKGVLRTKADLVARRADLGPARSSQEQTAQNLASSLEIALQQESDEVNEMQQQVNRVSQANPDYASDTSDDAQYKGDEA